MKYEVEKLARGTDGQWFGYGARRFRDIAAARAYLSRFAAEQAAVGGARIELRARRGRVLLAVATEGRITEVSPCPA